jgi:hypothetical protein
MRSIWRSVRGTQECLYGAANRYSDRVFEADLPCLGNDSQIVDLRQNKPKRRADGRLVDYRFSTMAGHSYGARVYLPDHPMSDVPILFPAAWWTGLDGHNAITSEMLSDDGHIVILVGGEGSGHLLFDRGGRFNGISVGRSAAALLRFSQVVTDADFKHDMDPHKRLILGESRGSMVGIGAIALLGTTEEYEQSVYYSDLTAPCFPRLPKFEDAGDLFIHGFREVNMLRKLTKLLGKEAVRYPSTIDLHPASVLHQLAMIWPLLNADVGRFARLVPNDTVAHLTGFSHDAWSMFDEWEKLFAEYPDIWKTPLDGSHLTLTDPETRAFVYARLQAAREQMNAGAERVGIRALRDRSHKLVEGKEDNIGENTKPALALATP